LTSSPSEHVEFVCNICGRENRTARTAFGRETPSCGHCGSTVRTRGIVHMISREIFGLDITLPDFPVLKGIRGIGISDSADYAERLAEKFDYSNTHYHKAPQFDIVNVPETEFGQYDFLIASEVFEHVAPPVERAFENAFRLLKPNGLFFFTVPYTLESRTAEHFPDLHEHGLARVGDQFVLVNRTRDGALQVFDDLVFHGGAGSTLEIRRFSESDLRAHFLDAGFRAVEVYAGGYAPFGVCHLETWSLPMTGRKEPFALDSDCTAALMEQWIQLRARWAQDSERAEQNKLEYERFVEWANRKIAETEDEVVKRTAWAQGLEKQLAERTEWALSMEKDVQHHVELAKQFQAEARERSDWALIQEAEAQDLRVRLQRNARTRWMRLGRALGLVKE
jgi:SAM-dependent methyltransferase